VEDNIKIQVTVSWVMTTSNDVFGYQLSEDLVASSFLRNICILPQYYTEAQPRRPRLDISSPWISQTSHQLEN